MTPTSAATQATERPEADAIMRPSYDLFIQSIDWNAGNARGFLNVEVRPVETAESAIYAATGDTE